MLRPDAPSLHNRLYMYPLLLAFEACACVLREVKFKCRSEVSWATITHSQWFMLCPESAAEQWRLTRRYRQAGFRTTGIDGCGGG